MKLIRKTSAVILSLVFLVSMFVFPINADDSGGERSKDKEPTSQSSVAEKNTETEPPSEPSKTDKETKATEPETGKKEVRQKIAQRPGGLPQEICTCVTDDEFFCEGDDHEIVKQTEQDGNLIRFDSQSINGESEDRCNQDSGSDPLPSPFERHVHTGEEGFFQHQGEKDQQHCRKKKFQQTLHEKSCGLSGG